jgi:hypothetical protein
MAIHSQMYSEPITALLHDSYNLVLLSDLFKQISFCYIMMLLASFPVSYFLVEQNKHIYIIFVYYNYYRYALKDAIFRMIKPE